eukprot:3451714-Pleurochrysis_carterae.AAC.1
MACVPPNLHSVEVDSHSWLTDSRESWNDGTQRTFRSVRRCVVPRESTASMGISPSKDWSAGEAVAVPE